MFCMSRRLILILMGVVLSCAFVARSQEAELSVPVNLLFVEKVAREHAGELRALADKSVAQTPEALVKWASQQLSVKVHFYSPKPEQAAAAAYFGPGSEKNNAWRWEDILLVDPMTGTTHANDNFSRFQVRARVTGPAALLALSPTFPIRIYRTYMNEVADGETEFENAYRCLFGKVDKDATGCVAEPEGLVVELKRITGIQGNTAYYVSEVIDLHQEKALNPACGLQAPSFAAFDSDAYFTQFHETPGDEEADGWAWSRALSARGFVSAGLAHPRSTQITGRITYQFSLGLGDKSVLDIPGALLQDEVTDAEARKKLYLMPAALRVGALKDRLKNMGASRVLGRPIANGAFIVSTGVQKLVATAGVRSQNGDLQWRMPGLVHVLDGWMDQCLVRAPAQLFLFSGHGWSDGNSPAFLNCYTGHNPSIGRNWDITLLAHVSDAQARWLSANRIDLSRKWLKNEVRLQWVMLLGCYGLNQGNGPFSSGSSSGQFGRLLINELGAKGVLGFEEHGFSSATFMTRFVTQAAQRSIAEAWLDLWHDTEAQAYTWYEQNESFGVSARKTYNNALCKIVPAYLIRKDNVKEALLPENLSKPPAGEMLEYGLFSQQMGVTLRSGTFQP